MSFNNPELVAKAVADEELRRAGAWLALSRAYAKWLQTENARLRAELASAHREADAEQRENDLYVQRQIEALKLRLERQIDERLQAEVQALTRAGFEQAAGFLAGGIND